MDESVDPFTPGPSFEELAARKLTERGERWLLLPFDVTAPDGHVVAEGTRVTVRQAQALGVRLMVGVT